MEIRALHLNRASRATRLLAPTSLLAGAVGLVPGQALAAELPSSCTAPSDPYKASPATRDACGIKSFPLERKVTNSDGSTAYSYVVGGKTFTFHLPPPGFHAASASAAELARNGVPAEPPASDPVGRTHWHQLIRNLHFAAPSSELLELPRREDRCTALSAGITNCWAGYVDSDPGTNAYTRADGEFQVPSFNTASCSKQGNQAASFWSGLGGYNSGNLAQDGIGTGGGLGTDQAWVEILPDSEVPIDGLDGTPGGQFVADTIWDGGGEFQFFLEDLSTGDGVDVTAPDEPYDGSSAEYIAERPTEIDGSTTSLFALTNFGTFSQTAALTNGTTPVQDLSNTELQMDNDGGTYRLATTEPVSGSGAFQVNWDNCS